MGTHAGDVDGKCAGATRCPFQRPAGLLKHWDRGSSLPHWPLAPPKAPSRMAAVTWPAVSGESRLLCGLSVLRRGLIRADFVVACSLYVTVLCHTSRPPPPVPFPLLLQVGHAWTFRKLLPWGPCAALPSGTGRPAAATGPGSGHRLRACRALSPARPWENSAPVVSLSPRTGCGSLPSLRDICPRWPVAPSASVAWAPSLLPRLRPRHPQCSEVTGAPWSRPLHTHWPVLKGGAGPGTA